MQNFGTGSIILKKEGQMFTDKWQQMQPSVSKILNQNGISKYDWHNLFSDVLAVSFWDKNGPTKLYEELTNNISEHISFIKEKIYSNLDDEALLRAYIAEWRRFSEQSLFLQSPFETLDERLSNNQQISAYADKKKYIVRNLMLETWNKNIVSDIKSRLQNGAMNIVYSERNGGSFDSQLVIGLRESFVTLSTDSEKKLIFYKENFEKQYIEAMVNFYAFDTTKHFDKHGVVSYINYAKTKLKQEEFRAQKYLETYLGYEKVFNEHCVKILIETFKNSIAAECPRMIKENNTNQLQIMFRLLDRVSEGVKPMCDALEQYIFDDGLADMLDSAATISKDLEKYTEKLLSLFNRFSKLVTQTFDNDKRFVDSRDSGFRRLVNDTSVFKLEIPSDEKSLDSVESKFPEFLSTFCDILLRKTAKSKKLTSDQIEKKLKDAILILRYVVNIDVFILFYRSQLTKRLILGTSLNMEKEENMITWMRDDAKAPTNCVGKLIQMLRDVKISEELSEQFKTENNGRLDGFNIQILTRNAWFRSCDKVSVSLPRELEALLPKFETFYSSKHNERRLQWNHKMSHGVISFNNSIGKFDLQVNTLQMAVLFAWNDLDIGEISLEDLKLATELSDFELKKTLLSLIACSKINRQIICCKPEVKSIMDFKSNTQFYINEEFGVVKNGKLRTKGSVNVMTRLQYSTGGENEQINHDIIQLRILRVQEGITKITKMRKGLLDVQLETELVKMLKHMFLPTKKMIAEQIEWMVANEHIIRNEDGRLFHYLEIK